MGRGSAAACEEMALVGALVGEGATATLLPCYHIFGHCDTCLLLFWCLWRTDNPTKAPSVLIDPVGDTRVSEQENALSHPTGATAQASTLCHKGILNHVPTMGQGWPETQPGGDSKEQTPPNFPLANQTRLTHPVVLLNHVINISPGRRHQRQVFPFQA